MATEHDRKSDEFIPVNQILNAKPQLGPIPGEQVIPWLLITVGSYVICEWLLKLDWWATLLVAVWGSVTWWILTGNESWRFLSKFQGTPRWTRGHLSYSSPLHQKAAIESPHPHKKRSSKKQRIRR